MEGECKRYSNSVGCEKKIPTCNIQHPFYLHWAPFSLSYIFIHHFQFNFHRPKKIKDNNNCLNAHNNCFKFTSKSNSSPFSRQLNEHVNIVQPERLTTNIRTQTILEYIHFLLHPLFFHTDTFGWRLALFTLALGKKFNNEKRNYSTNYVVETVFLQSPFFSSSQ